MFPKLSQLFEGLPLGFPLNYLGSGLAIGGLAYFFFRFYQNVHQQTALTRAIAIAIGACLYLLVFGFGLPTQINPALLGKTQDNAINKIEHEPQPALSIKQSEPPVPVPMGVNQSTESVFAQIGPFDNMSMSDADSPDYMLDTETIMNL